MAEILRTPRLSLRELCESDIEFLVEFLGDPRVMRFWPAPLDRDGATRWLADHQTRYSRDGFGYWLIIERESGRPIGQAGLLRMEIEGVVEAGIGYMLLPAHQGRGLALEAARGVIDWARGRGFNRPSCLVRPENVDSLRVAIRAGYLPRRMVRYKGFAHLYLALESVAESPAGETGPSAGGGAGASSGGDPGASAGGAFG
ncbi:MAG: GNAT family N-acetyltransferase [Phycisphaerales bacterium]|nr:GNAT family N-acetyltransferase [Phycisphaerales bacterium]